MRVAAAAVFCVSAWAGLACAAWAAEVRDPHGVAVVIGNRAYTHERVPDVDYAHRDALAFKRYVLDVLGFDPENVIDLRDASKAQLETAFGNERDHKGLVWRYLEADGSSDVVVFYSGHGVPGLADGRGYLLPADADPNTAHINSYAIDTLSANLAKLEEARSVRVFLDACFSGDSAGGDLVDGFSGAPVLAALSPDPAARMTVLTAATGGQVASWDREAEHGMFTHHLLDALYGAGDADDDGRVTAAEAKAYLDRHMTKAARRTFGRIQNADLGGDEEAVLSAPPGRFPARPEIELVSGGAVAGPDPDPDPSLDAARTEDALALEPADRKAVQMGLESLVGSVGHADGVFGPQTRAALRRWQEGRGLEPTGYLTRQQADALVEAGQGVLAKVLAVGEVFRDCPHCPEMVVVPAGSFTMGSPSSESGRDSNEGPQRRVEISSPFSVGVYEVTFAEWDACVSDGGCGGYHPDDEGWGRGNRPVINVNWDDAQAYASWLSRETGEEYRLLSEAEWEYVARAGTATARYWGESASDQCGYANGADLTAKRHRSDWTVADCDDGHYRTSPVGSFRPNGFGLHDVLGNAWEWVEDCWHGNYEDAPRDGRAWLENNGGDCSRRVLRGGSWSFAPGSLRAAYRGRIVTGRRDYNFGFRPLRAVRTFTP